MRRAVRTHRTHRTDPTHPVMHSPAIALRRLNRLLPAMLALLATLALLAGGPAGAAGARAFPGDTIQVQLTGAGNGYISTREGYVLKLASGVIIRDPTNRTVTRNRLPTDAVVRLLLNRGDQVQQIWILAPDEIDSNPTNERTSRQLQRAGSSARPLTGAPVDPATSAPGVAAP